LVAAGARGVGRRDRYCRHPDSFSKESLSRMLPISDYLFLSFALLLIGAVGVVTRRNLIIKLFSIELILNAAGINLMAFARFFADGVGETFSAFIILMVAAQVLVAMAIIAAVFTRWLNVSTAPAKNPEQSTAAN
jgi:NADH-quinone oxidoreductase subunit K